MRNCTFVRKKAGFDRSVEPGFDCRAASLFKTGAKGGKLKILEWGESSGCKLNDILNESGIAHAAEKMGIWRWCNT